MRSNVIRFSLSVSHIIFFSLEGSKVYIAKLDEGSWPLGLYIFKEIIAIYAKITKYHRIRLKARQVHARPIQKEQACSHRLYKPFQSVIHSFIKHVLLGRCMCSNKPIIFRACLPGFNEVPFVVEDLRVTVTDAAFHLLSICPIIDPNRMRFSRRCYSLSSSK